MFLYAFRKVSNSSMSRTFGGRKLSQSEFKLTLGQVANQIIQMESIIN